MGIYNVFSYVFPASQMVSETGKDKVWWACCSFQHFQILPACSILHNTRGCFQWANAEALKKFALDDERIPKKHCVHIRYIKSRTILLQLIKMHLVIIFNVMITNHEYSAVMAGNLLAITLISHNGNMLFSSLCTMTTLCGPIRINIT